MINEEQKKMFLRDLAVQMGIEIKVRRVKMRMSIREVSELTGITQSAISKIERGESDMKLSTLAILRSVLAFDVSISDVKVDMSDYEMMQPEPD